MADVTIGQLSQTYAPLTLSNAIPLTDGTTTSRVSIDNLLANAFGSQTTAGVLDWNHVSNTKPGCINNTLLTGNATNGPQVGGYYHPLNFEYSSKSGTGNVTQLAVAYGTPGNELCMRGRYSGTWSSWVRFLNSSNYTSYAVPTNSPQIAKAWVRINSLQGSSTANGADLTSYIGASYNINRLVKSGTGAYYLAYFTNPLVGNDLCGTGTSYGNNSTYNFVAGMTFTNTYVSFAICAGPQSYIQPTGPTSIIVYGL